MPNNIICVQYLMFSQICWISCSNVSYHPYLNKISCSWNYATCSLATDLVIYGCLFACLEFYKTFIRCHDNRTTYL